MTFGQSEMTEWEFVSEVANRADCWLLFDVNNVYVSAFNHGFASDDFLNGVPRDRVVQFHVAGHSHEETHLIDTHDHPVCDEVWDFYRAAVAHFGPVSTMIERDDDESPPPPPRRLPEPQAILVWRQDVTARFRTLGTEEAMMWDEAAAGTRFGVLCEMVATYGGEDGADFRAASYLKDWVDMGSLAGFRFG